MKSVATIMMIALMAAGQAGCASRYKTLPPHLKSDFNRQRYDSAVTKLEPWLEKVKSPDYPLNLLRYGSAALYAGQYEKSQDAFLRATERLENFAPDGEFKAIATREESKEFRGDPYEQMMAFYYLALQDYRQNRYDMALAGLKTALLADSGSREERYRADSGLVLYFMGMAQQRLRQTKPAQQSFDDVRNLMRYQVVYEKAAKALKKAAGELRTADRKRVDVTQEIYLRELSLNAWLHQDAALALEQSAESAEATIQYYTRDPGKSDDPSGWRKIGADREKVVAMVFQLKARAMALLETVEVADRQREYEAFVTAFEPLTRPENNVMLVLELGKGPYKYSTGDYDSRLAYGRGAYSERACRAVLGGGTTLTSLNLDDLYRQASTRGGRDMDDFLRGKVVFKNVTAVAAVGALVAADVLYHNSESNAAGNIALASGVALAALSLATTPQADIRYWEFLPGEVHVIATRLEPGSYPLTLEFLDGNGNPLAGMTQTHTVTVEPDRENLFLFRSGKAAGY